jgi:SAM-dependent methyltransferase
MQLATTLIGIDAPLPLIDLDQISTIVADTYDYTASTYDEKQFGTVAEPLEAFVQLLKKQQKRHILDIGCNVGWEASFLIARGSTVVGIDTSTEMVQKASTRAPQAKSYQMKMHDLRFPPEQTFEAIWSTRTLIHIPQALVIDLLASWKRVLKPGGILGIGVNIGDRNGWETTEDTAGRAMFYHYFAEGELEKALETAGYQVLEKHERNAGGTPNYFVFAQRSDTRLDKPAYLQYMQYAEDGKQGTVKPEDLEQAIALFLRAGSLTPREQVNLCLLYDQLATLNRADDNKYKLTAQKLKLHLQTPETLSAEDFDLWFTMGQLHHKLTRFPQAVSCLELAHRLRPDHFATLVQLSYCYEGLNDPDKAIATAHKAELLAEQDQMSDEERAEVYHALGHFYVSRSRHGSSETSISDRERGDHYMQRACSLRINYLGCLASLFNETKRYPETILLFDESNNSEKVRAHEELLNELYFYQAEAYMGTDRYDLALANLDQVERYARANRNWDALAHVKLYQVRIGVKSKDVRDLSLDEIRSYLSDLYSHEPSLYDAVSFKRDRENLINILSAFYLINPCLNEQEPPGDFDERVAGAIYHMEEINEREGWDLNLLVLADNVSALPGVLLTAKYTPHWFPFEEVETDSAEREMDRCRVWAVLALTGDIQASAMANLTFCIGRFFHRAGYAIYIYDPKRVFPEIIRKSLHEFFVDDIEEITQFTHVNMLYDKAREYLNDTRSSLGLLYPLGAPVEDIDLLPIEGGVSDAGTPFI